MRDPRDDIEALWREIEAAAPLSDDELARTAPPGVDYDEWYERAHTQSERRRSFIARFGYAVPDRGVIRAIAAFLQPRLVLEVCAGAGLWARLLADAGLRVIATDATASRPEDYYAVEGLLSDAAVAAHPECEGLFLCWPPFRHDAAFRALSGFRGDRVAYVGDARFTGDEQLQAALAAGWVLREKLLVPAWPGLDDYAYLYERRADTDG